MLASEDERNQEQSGRSGAARSGIFPLALWRSPAMGQPRADFACEKIVDGNADKC